MLKSIFSKKTVTNRPIIICTTMRSGSTMVCEDMRNTGSLGTAKELFIRWNPDNEQNWQDRLAKLIENNKTSNGVFSVKVMSRYLPTIEACLEKSDAPKGAATVFPCFSEAFKDAVWVYLKRDDIVGQAISRFVSNHTGVFHNFDDKRHKKSAEVLSDKGESDYASEVPYNANKIAQICQRINDEQIVWEHFFKENNIDPYRITYEECVKDFRTYLTVMARTAGVKLAKMPAERTIKKLANNRSAEIHSKFSNETVQKIIEDK